MKTIQIIGYKKSGKTTLAAAIKKIWKEKNINSDFAKFSHHSFDKADTDTALLQQADSTVLGLSPEETALFFGKNISLTDLLPFCKNEILLIEGGKNLTWLPRVLCLNDKEEAKTLDHGLAIATFGRDESTNTGNFPHFTEKSLPALADLMYAKAFRLAGLNCKACHRNSCAELATEILQNKAQVSDCTALYKDTNALAITVNGIDLALNPFTEKMIQGTLDGMLSTLKGYAHGKINITFSAK